MTSNFSPRRCIWTLILCAINIGLFACGDIVGAYSAGCEYTYNQDWEYLQLKLHTDESRYCPLNPLQNEYVITGGAIEDLSYDGFNTPITYYTSLTVNNKYSSCLTGFPGTYLNSEGELFGQREMNGQSGWEWGTYDVEVQYPARTGGDPNGDCGVWEVDAGYYYSSEAKVEMSYDPL